MLRPLHLHQHQEFLKHLLRAKTVRAVRRSLAHATYSQLRTLVLLVAFVALKKVPAAELVRTVFYYSRKKRLLKAKFGSWRKVKALLATRDAAQWRVVLTDLAPLVQPTVDTFVHI